MLVNFDYVKIDYYYEYTCILNFTFSPPVAKIVLANNCSLKVYNKVVPQEGVGWVQHWSNSSFDGV